MDFADKHRNMGKKNITKQEIIWAWRQYLHFMERGHLVQENSAEKQ